MTKNLPVQIYPNIIKNRIVFKLKTGYKLELLTPETMKLLGSRKKDLDKDKDGHMLQFNTNYMVDIIKMRYLTEPRYRKYVKGFDFLPFARKLGDKYVIVQ